MSEKHVCVIGAGRHSTANLYPVLLSLGDVVIDAVCTRNLEVARETAGKCGGQTRAYDSIDEMLEKETCGTVIICVPGVVSAETAAKCLEKGWNVFCEKPLGMSLQEARLIDEACERSGASYMTAFMKKFAPVYRSIRKAADQKTYGNVLSYRGAFNVDASRFCKTDRDFMYFVAIHYFALVRFLFGKPEKITAVCNASGSGRSYHLLLLHPGNVTGSLQFENRSAWTKEYESLDVTFDNAYMHTENLGELRIHESGTENGELSEKETVLRTSEFPGSGIRRDLVLRGFWGELEHFLTGDSFDKNENREVTEMIENILAAL